MIVKLESPSAPSLRVPVPFLRSELPAGDLVRQLTRALGIQPCSPCEQRQKALNQLVTLKPWGAK